MDETITAAEISPHAADLALAQAMLKRDRKAAAEFVQRFSDSVARYVRSRLAPRWEHVDDIVQETFLTGLRSIHNYRGDSPMNGWLLGIARHKVEDHYRELVRGCAVPEDVLDIEVVEDPGFDGLLDREAAEERIREILKAMPEHYRAALSWRYWEQRPAAEMAELTGRSVKSIERILARARIEFAQRWRSQTREATV